MTVLVMGAPFNGSSNHSRVAAMEPVLVERKGPITVVTIDRPQARNAVDGPTADALDAAFEDFDGDPEASVAVLTGAGGTFCAGADLKAITSGDERLVTRLGSGVDGPMGPTRRELSKPVIAAIEGYAVAGGMELALWCDLRVAGSDATMGIFNRRWGVPLIDGGTVRLPRVVGHGRALELILTGRAVDADEALRIGLVNRVCEPGTALATAIELAEEISRYPQTTMRHDRVSAIAAWALDLRAALENEHRLGLEALSSGESSTGAQRFASGKGRGGSFEDL
jgi:enoyl-CoA hydratase